MQSGGNKTCPRCGARATHVAWGVATASKVVVNALLVPFLMLGGYFGDKRGFYFPVDHECGSCGARFVPERFPRPNPKST
jgi:hypothetical protein